MTEITSHCSSVPISAWFIKGLVSSVRFLQLSHPSQSSHLDFKIITKHFSSNQHGAQFPSHHSRKQWAAGRAACLMICGRLFLTLLLSAFKWTAWSLDMLFLIITLLCSNGTTINYYTHTTLQERNNGWQQKDIKRGIWFYWRDTKWLCFTATARSYSHWKEVFTL